MLHGLLKSLLGTLVSLMFVVSGFNVYARVGADASVPAPVEPGTVDDAELAQGLELYESGDYAAAWRLFHSACDRGLPMGCNNVGIMLGFGTLGPVDVARAEVYLQRACDQGVGMACGNLGRLLARGGRPAAEIERGIALLARGCEIGSASACTKYGEIQSPFMTIALRPDAVGSQAAYRRGCELNDPVACENLALLLVQGLQGRSEPDQARAAATHGCLVLQDAANCVLLAMRIPGIDSTYLEASRWLAYACRYGDGDACLTGPLMATRGVRIRPATHEQRLVHEAEACATGVGDGCAEYGQHLFDGAGVPQDRVRAVAIFRQGCAANSGESCARLGVAAGLGQGMVRDDDAAARWFERACDLDSANGCFNLSRARALGVGVARDSALADRFRRRSCDLGYEPACIELAHVLLQQEGAPATVDAPSAALALLDQGCAAGGLQSCREAYRVLMMVPGTPVQLAPRMTRALDYARRVCTLERGSNCAVTADPSLQARLAEVQAMIARCEANGDMSRCQ